MYTLTVDPYAPRALFVFGTYTIGKERLFLEVAAEMGSKVRTATPQGCTHLQPVAVGHVPRQCGRCCDLQVMAKVEPKGYTCHP